MIVAINLPSCRVRAETLGQLVSSLQSSTLQQSGLVKQSVKLLERYRNFQTDVLTGCGKTQSPVSRDEEVLQIKQSCGRDLRQHGASPTSGRLVIQSPAEQRLHCAHVRRLTSLSLLFMFCTDLYINH